MEKVSKKCLGKKSYQETTNCLNSYMIPFITRINAQPYKRFFHINQFSVYQLILPEDGSIGTKINGSSDVPTLSLNQTYDYNVYLLDKDYFLMVSNPIVIQRTFFKLRSMGNSMVGIALKVCT